VNAQLAAARAQVAETWMELEWARACAAMGVGRISGDKGVDGSGEVVEALALRLRVLLPAPPRP
jgi:hypothetical protein